VNRYPWRLLVVALVTVASVAVLATPPAAAYLAPAGQLAPVTIPAVYRPVEQTLSQPEAQPTQTPRGVTVDWLGVRFAGTRDLPPLALTNVYTPGPGGPDWYHVILDYTRADDPSRGRASGSTVTLLVGPRRPWNPPQVPRGPCWARHEITLPHGRASIFMGFASMGDVVAPCPTRPYDRFMALAYLGQTMVFVDAGDAIDHSVWPILYNTREGMEVVVRALRPRVPAKGETAMPVAAHPGPPLSPAWLIAFLIVGALAGALAALLMHEGGYGLASDMLAGIIGALLGGLLHPRGFLSDHLDVDRALLTASIVACALIALKIALVYGLGSTRPRPTEQTPGVSRSPAPTRPARRVRADHCVLSGG
jgi:uncharacterized membrane protein YeaQ/YmgE (transglycosylase-associated protein family)